MESSMAEKEAQEQEQEQEKHVRMLGSVWSWGAGTSGQLGNGRLEDADTPTEVDALRNKRVVHIACGGSHAAAVLENGEVLSWGWEGSGALGQGRVSPQGHQPLPRPVKALQSTRVQYAAAGWAHTVFVAEGVAYACGSNAYGQLGVDGGDRTLPTRIHGIEGVYSAACGLRHTLLLAKPDQTGARCYSFGSNRHGQLGRAGDSQQPAQLTSLQREECTAVAAGGDKSAVLTGEHNNASVIVYYVHENPLLLPCVGDGRIMWWGRGWLGRGDTAEPVEVDRLPKCRALSLGWMHGLALTEDGHVYSWGSNRAGQLGANSANNSSHSPQLVCELSLCVSNIAAGAEHSAAATGTNMRCIVGVGVNMGKQDRNTHKMFCSLLAYTFVLTRLECSGDQCLSPLRVTQPLPMTPAICQQLKAALSNTAPCRFSVEADSCS
eukprot:jgi/Chlat1/5121/Chrsp33S05026